jgi:Response regulators consisting of a CheY-like receiver domain and a winged-helix DNA-binding domain
MPKILVVDDDEDLLFLGSSLLRQSGYNVFSLAKAENVGEVIKTFQPDLMLLDIKLGDLDGRDICFDLKSNPGTRAIKIILYSAFPETSVDVSNYGADDFVLKPYNFKYLATRIDNLLKFAAR